MRRGSGWGISALTGQGKAEKEEKEPQIYTGDTLKEVREDYSRSQQYYLDTGHVQAVLLGEGLLEEEAFLEQALAEMEDNRMLGSGCYVFSCKEPEVFLKLDGSEVDSLGNIWRGFIKTVLLIRGRMRLPCRKSIPPGMTEGNFRRFPR